MDDDINRKVALNRAAAAISAAEKLAAPSAANLLKCAELWLMLAEEIRATFEIRAGHPG